jgi:CMP-N,N'-diacetyllegionaminic acid synthase
MIGEVRTLAVVTARGGSKGLPGKNGRPLLGRPLLAWPVGAALASRTVDRVVVSTDDPGLADLARAAGAEVPFLRPAELAGDLSPSAAAVIHALDVLARAGDRFGYVILLEPTSPLTEASDVDGAMACLHASRSVADAIVGVARTGAEHPDFAVSMDAAGVLAPWAGGGLGCLPRRQDLRPAYRLDGSLYASDVAAFREAGGFLHGRTMGWTMPRYKSLEIDDLLDFVCVEAIAARISEFRGETEP